MNITETKERPMLSLEEVKEALTKILKSNNYKKGSRDARTCEVAFLQGLMTGDPRQVQRPIYVICIMSGRSILD